LLSFEEQQLSLENGIALSVQEEIGEECPGGHGVQMVRFVVWSASWWAGELKDAVPRTEHP
jgi:putative AlgH/UPF0301 family transcriptional regulator